MDGWFLDSYLKIPQPLEQEFPADLRLIVVLPGALDPEPADTLANIIKACGLEVGRQTVEIHVTRAVALGNGLPVVDDARLVSFGVSPQNLGLQHHCAVYQWLQIGGRQWCFAERLELIGADMERKKRLWACVKELKISPPAS